MMKKALLSLLLAFVCLPSVFAQSEPGTTLLVDTIASCQSYTWPRNNQQYNNDTVVLFTSGDTVFVLNFTKMASYVDTTEAVEITGDCSASWNGKVWNTMGSFLDTLTAVSGCDSVVKVNVHLASIDSVKEVTVCGSYTAPWGEAYTESRVIDTTVTNGDCTYHNVITLTVHPEYVNPVAEEITAGCSYLWNGMTLTDTNVYTKRFTTVEGQCDSIVSIRIIAFTGEQSDTVAVVACDAYKAPWMADSVYTSGIQVHDSAYGTYLTTDGPASCLHHDAIDITIVNSISDSADVTPTLINAGCSYQWNGVTYTDTAVHYHMYSSTIGGCDSLVAIKISFSNHNYDTTFAEYCGSTYDWKASCPTLPLPGAATLYRYTADTVVTVSVNDTTTGCATDYTLVLSFYSKADTVNQYYCGTAYNYTFKKYNESTHMWQNATTTFTTGGYHVVSAEGDTLFAVANGTNCKTYRTLNLNLNLPEQRFRADSIDTVVCEQFRFKADRKYGSWIRLTNSCDTNIAHEERSQSNQARCYDSIVHVTLVVNRNSFIERTATVCDSYVWDEFTGDTYTESGVYNDTLPERNANGCLQIGRLTLTVNKTPVVNIEGEWMLEPHGNTVLKAVPQSGSDPITLYKWYVDDVLSQSGSTADSLVLEDVDHNTEVRLESKSSKNCVATNWITVTANVGIDDVDALQVNIYPNPASRYLNIESGEVLGDVTVFNTVGQQVVNRHVDGNGVQLDLSGLATGTYTLRINGTDGRQTTRKFIVTK